jgi:very-short-patch-repair endonuclease
VVELDGRAAHAATVAFERDRALQAAGSRVLRITWRQLHDEPRSIATDLERMLV